MTEPNDNILEISQLKNYLGGRWVHNGLDLTVKKGEIVAIIGPSGCGKTTLLRTILMLRKPTSGSIKVFGIDVVRGSEREADEVRRRWGVMFQSGALFSSLTLLENVMFPLNEYANISSELKKEIALLKILLAGLKIDTAAQYPGELSGGMQKRAALARAIALDPELLFLDEPTTGLDPKSADEIDDLILYLRDHLGITFVIVSHDLDTLWRVPDRVIFLGEGKVLAAEKMSELIKQDQKSIKSYFSGPRAKERRQNEEGSGSH